MTVKCEFKDKPFEQENHQSILGFSWMSKLICLNHLPLDIMEVLPVEFSPLGYFKLSSTQSALFLLNSMLNGWLITQGYTCRI